MKQQLIKEITDEVVKYVPEIMELKFGCRIWRKDNEGRDITLEDVLIAANKNSLFSDVKLAITSEGLFFDTASYSVIDWDTEVFWQLGKPLHEQDEKTLQFIRNILK